MTLEELNIGSLEELFEQWRYKPLRAGARHELEQYEDATQKEERKPDPWYSKQRANETETEWLMRLRRQKLWYLMVDTEKRGFLQSCKRARSNGEHDRVTTWLEPNGPLDQILKDAHMEALAPFFRAHLCCAQLSNAGDEMVVGLGAGTKLGPGFLRDLAEEFFSGGARPALRSASLVVVLLGPDGRGRAANLVMDVVSPGKGDFYPSPEMSLIALDSQYSKSEQRARQFVDQWIGSYDQLHDIRWRLVRRGKEPLPPAINGPSASAAVGLLYAHLAATTRLGQVRKGVRLEQPLLQPVEADQWSTIEELSQLDLSGVAISAEVDTDYRFTAIGGALSKASTARYDDPWLPRIHTIVFALNQKQNDEGGTDTPNPLETSNDPYEEFGARFAETFRETLQVLAKDAKKRWSRIVDCSGELDRDGYSEGLFREMGRVLRFLEAEIGGYQLVQADELLDTSAFASQLIKRIQCHSYPVAYHFIRSDRENWDDHSTILDSLGDQLRRQFALRRDSEDENKPAIARFKAILDRVGGSLDRLARLGAAESRAVLILDGLDRAFRRGKRFDDVVLKNILPVPIPRRVKFVLISRVGPHLHIARCPYDVEPIDLNPWRASPATPEDGDMVELLSGNLTKLKREGNPDLRRAIRALSIFSEPELVLALKAVRPDLDWEETVLPRLMDLKLIDRVHGEDRLHRYIARPLLRELLSRENPQDGDDVTRKTLHARAADYYVRLALDLAAERRLSRAREGDTDQRWLRCVDLLSKHLSRAKSWDQLISHHHLIQSAYVVKYNWGYYDKCRAVVRRMLAAAGRLKRTDIEVEWLHQQAVLYHTIGKLTKSEAACRSGWRLVKAALVSAPTLDENSERRLLEMGGHLQCRLGMVLRDQGHYEAGHGHQDGALECFAESARLKRSAARVYSNDLLYNECLWAEILSEQGQLVEARKILDNAVRIAMEDASRRKDVVHRAVCFAPLLVRVLRRQGECEHAIALGRLAKFMAAGIHHWLHLVQNLREIAIVGTVTEDSKCALESFQEIEESNRLAEADDVLPMSEITRTQLALGFFHHLDRNLIDARRCYENAIRPGVSPASYQGAVLLGALAMQELLPVPGASLTEPRGFLDRGIEMCGELLARSSRALEPAYFLARASILKGRLEEAEGRALASEEQYQSVPTYYLAASGICAAKGVVDEELQFLKLTANALPRTPRFAAALKSAEELLSANLEQSPDRR